MSVIHPQVRACSSRADTKRTLAFVNKLRSSAGLRPLRFLKPGVATDSMRCSIAASLTTKYTTASVGKTEITIYRASRDGKRTSVVVFAYYGVKNEAAAKKELVHRGAQNTDRTSYFVLPQYVNRWIQMFDDGKMTGMYIDA